MRWLLLLLLLLACLYALRRTCQDSLLYPTWKLRCGNVVWNFCWFFLYGIGMFGFTMLLASFRILEWRNRHTKHVLQETSREYDLAALHVEATTASNSETGWEREE